MIDWEGLPEDFNIKDYVGFIYIITNLHTNKKYIGQKMFWKKIRRKPLKGTKRVRLDRLESDWKTYYSSCNKLKEDITAIGKHHFKRQILMLCKSKAEMNYAETRLQFEHQVLLSPGWYNQMINCRIAGHTLPEYMMFK